MILLLQSATCDVIATWVVVGDNTQVSKEYDVFTDNMGESNNLDKYIAVPVSLLEWCSDWYQDEEPMIEKEII